MAHIMATRYIPDLFYFLSNGFSTRKKNLKKIESEKKNCTGRKKSTWTSVSNFFLKVNTIFWRIDNPSITLHHKSKLQQENFFLLLWFFGGKSVFCWFFSLLFSGSNLFTLRQVFFFFEDIFFSAGISVLWKKGAAQLVALVFFCTNLFLTEGQKSLNANGLKKGEKKVGNKMPFSGWKLKPPPHIPHI